MTNTDFMHVRNCSIYRIVGVLMARRHPGSVGYGMGYTPKLLFCTESPHHFKTSVSIQAAMKMSSSALMPNNLLGGNCSRDLYLQANTEDGSSMFLWNIYNHL
jgi:hypothetical protein